MEIKDKDLEIFSYEGTDYQTLLTRKFTDRKRYQPEDLTKIIAQMPGTIVKIMVKEGQQINPSKCLFILEAMKMKNKVHSLISGTIIKIHVQEGQIVPKNGLLVELDVEAPGKKLRKSLREGPEQEKPARKKRFGRKKTG